MAPGRLLLQYGAGQTIVGSSAAQSAGTNTKLVDLRVYYSNNNTVKEPNEQAYSRVYHNPQRAVVLSTQPGNDYFDGEYVYLSMLSTTGCSLVMTLLFKD